MVDRNRIGEQAASNAETLWMMAGVMRSLIASMSKVAKCSLFGALPGAVAGRFLETPVDVCPYRVGHGDGLYEFICRQGQESGDRPLLDHMVGMLHRMSPFGG